MGVGCGSGCDWTIPLLQPVSGRMKMAARSVAAVRRILLWPGREGPGLKPLVFAIVFRRAKALRSHPRTRVAASPVCRRAKVVRSRLGTRAGTFPVCRGAAGEQMREIEFTKNTNSSEAVMGADMAW